MVWNLSQETYIFLKINSTSNVNLHFLITMFSLTNSRLHTPDSSTVRAYAEESITLITKHNLEENASPGLDTWSMANWETLTNDHKEWSNYKPRGFLFLWYMYSWKENSLVRKKIKKIWKISPHIEYWLWKMNICHISMLIICLCWHLLLNAKCSIKCNVKHSGNWYKIKKYFQKNYVC